MKNKKNTHSHIYLYYCIYVYLRKHIKDASRWSPILHLEPAEQNNPMVDINAIIQCISQYILRLRPSIEIIITAREHKLSLVASLCREDESDHINAKSGHLFIIIPLSTQSIHCEERIAFSLHVLPLQHRWLYPDILRIHSNKQVVRRLRRICNVSKEET